MRLSNKLTLCILSLFLLAFAALPVLAHIDGATGETGHLAADATNHTPHPVVKSVTLKGAAADGYVKRGLFKLDFTFEPANEANEVALPRITTLGTSDQLAAMFGFVIANTAGGISGTLANGVPTGWVVTSITKNSGTSYTADILATGNADGTFVLGIAQAAVAADTPTQGDPAIEAVYTKPDTDPDETAGNGDETNPAKVRIELDLTAPLFTNETTTSTTDPTAPVVSPILPNRAPLDDKWEHPFNLTFYVRDDVSNIIDFTFEADPNKVSFSGVGGTGIKVAAPSETDSSATQYGVTVTPRRDVDISDGEEITITIKLSDKADNEGMITTKVKLKENTVAPELPSDGPDRTAPTVTIADAAGTGTDADKVIFTFTFSEVLATTGTNAFTVDDIDVSNAPTLVASNLATTDNKVFTLTVTPDNDAFPVKVSFKPTAKIGDAAGNVLVAAELAKTDTYTPPGVLGVEIDPPDTIGIDGSLTFTFTFAEEPAPPIQDDPATTDVNEADPNPPGMFTVNDIRVSNAQPLVAANLNKPLQSDDTDGVIYKLDVTPIDPTKPVTVQLKAGSVSNGKEGDDLLIAGQISATWDPPVPDTTAPVVSITAPTAAGASNSLVFTIDFDEALSAALTVDNLAITGAATTPAPALVQVTTGLPATGVAQRYTLTVTGTQGTAVTVNLKADAVMDAAGNKVAPLAAAASYTIPVPPGDTTPPTLTITHSPDNLAALPDSGVVTFTFTFNEALGSNDAAFTLADITIDNGSAADFRPSALVYALDVTPADVTLPVTVTVAASAVSDAAGNNLAAEVTDTYIAYDDKPPTVVITAVPGTGDNADKVVYTFTFSEPLKSSGDGAFTEADILRGTGVSLAGNPTVDATDNKVYTVLVIPAATGSTVLTLRTGSVQDLAGNKLAGDQSHTYVAPIAPGPATITTTDLGSTTPSATLTITFNKDPGTVKVGTDTLEGTGTTRTITASTTEGSNSVDLTWTGTDAGDSDNGSGTITYTISGSGNPTAPANIMMVNIPANAFVVLVRSNSSSVAALNFPTVPPVGGTAVDVREWAAMPDLHDLFRRSGQSPGGALVLRMSADDAADNRPALGTVGISEIMSARDLGKATSTDQAAGQWIELQNLNDKAVNVLIYAQKGSDGLISDGQLVNTAAGDNLLGNPGGMIVDAIQNIRNDGNQNAGGWDVKGKEGNSLTAQPFASMYRILPDKKTKYENADKSRFNDRKGTNAGHWVESGDVYVRGSTDATPPVLFDYRGTPGAINNVPGVTLLTPAGRTSVSHAITINEVGNNSNDAYDWIELKGAAGTNLRNYMISIVTSNSSDVPLVQFPANDNAKIADSGVFLILASDPTNDSNHPIAPGRNVNRAEVDHERYHWNSPVRSLVTNFSLPNDGKFVLILRSPDNGEGQRANAHGGKGVAETGNNDLNRVVDVAGWDDDLAKSEYPNKLSNTGVWPLHAFRDIKGFTHNSFAQNTVHQRNRVGTNDGASGVGAQDNNNGKTAFGDRGWTSVGYRRNVVASNANGGTPGYPNGAIHGAGATITDAVFISEIMYADATNGILPQWIELRNASNSVAADLNNWRLTIKNHVDAEAHQDGLWTGKVEASILLRGLKIKPNGVVLITSRKGPRSDVQLADNEIFSLYPAHRNTFGMTNATSDVINPFGFRITLHANGHEGDRNKWQSVDEVGNLATPNANDRRGNNERFDMPRWMWPDAIDESGNRSSVARKNNKAQGVSDGQMESSWVLSSMDNRRFRIDNVYYGNDGDISTPGQTVGSPLPVNLSFFRPTLEDGKVVVRWTTESELDNAGFNIYRSESRTGEFTQVNEALIQGKGTTAERSNYKWIDTSAKPGVAYYYQIEDVSFAGERQTLRTTKMKGLISAKDKLTTKWGELKEVH